MVEKTLTTINKITENIDEHNYKKVIEFLEIPLSIKGYGHVKEKNMKLAETQWEQSLEKLFKNKNFKKTG